jgi:DNA-binding MurR/RpiR family transcriptional regulator
VHEESVPIVVVHVFVAYTTGVVSTVAGATDSFADRVAARGDDVAPAERRVAAGLLELGAEASLLSAAALAKRLGTSDATIVRTAKALGYAGLAELRRALVAHTNEPPIGERLRRSLEQAPREELFAATVANHLAALEVLTRSVPAERFREAAGVLSASDRIVWRGVGPSAHLAAYGQLLAERVGKSSSALVHTGTSFADELLSLGSGDAIVLLAYGRLQAHVRVLLERAEAIDVPVVLITDTLGRRLGPAVHTTLECGRGTPGLFASHGATLVVVEALVLAVAAGDPAAAEASLGELNALRAALAGRRLDVDVP